MRAVGLHAERRSRSADHAGIGRPGRTGKGVILRLLILLLGGPERVTSVESPPRLAGRFSLGPLVDRAALLLPDLPAAPGERSQARASWVAGMAVIKALVGQDPLPVEAKGGETRTMILPAQVWAATNFRVGWVRGAQERDSVDRAADPHSLRTGR